MYMWNFATAHDCCFDPSYNERLARWKDRRCTGFVADTVRASSFTPSYDVLAQIMFDVTAHVHRGVHRKVQTVLMDAVEAEGTSAVANVSDHTGR